jgi:hypothetical protein
LTAKRMPMRSRRGGLPPNQVRPTERQIAENIIVVPKVFVDEKMQQLKIDPFAVMFLGEQITARKLDSECRISLPLRGRIAPGTVLALDVNNGVLQVELR